MRQTFASSVRISCSAAAIVLAGCAGARTLQPAATALPPPPVALTAITLNIWHDQEDWPARLEYIVATLRTLQPDVIALQEVLQHAELPNQAETIAERLGYHHFFTSVDTPGSPKRYGNAILTRHPVLVRNVRKLEPLDDYRTAAHVRVRVGTDSIDVYDTHLHHAADGGDEVRRTQVRDLLEFITATRAAGPALLLGDFNAPDTAPELGELAGAFTSVCALLCSTPDSITTLNPAKGHQRVRIDHIYYRHGATRALRPVSASVILDRPNDAGLWASDHFGLLGRFQLPGW